MDKIPRYQIVLLIKKPDKSLVSDDLWWMATGLLQFGPCKCVTRVTWFNSNVLWMTERWKILLKSNVEGISLVVQWWRFCLPMQETHAQSLAGKIPHAAEQLSPQAATTEPECCKYEASRLEPVPCKKRSHWDEKTVPVLAATRESPHGAMKAQSGHK